MYLFAPRESMRRLYLVVKDYAMVSPYALYCAGTRCKNMNFPINNVVTFSLVGQICMYTARYIYLHNVRKIDKVCNHFCVL